MTIGLQVYAGTLPPPRGVDVILGPCDPAAVTLRIARDGRIARTDTPANATIETGEPGDLQRLIPPDARELELRIDDGVEHWRVVTVIDVLSRARGRSVCVAID